METLNDKEAMKDLKAQMRELEPIKKQDSIMLWWEQPTDLLQSTGVKWRRQHLKRVESTLGAIPRRATPVRVPAEGWERLQDETDYVWNHSMTQTLKQGLMSS